MTMIDEASRANATIADDYDPARGKPPAPKIAIVTCADLRLTNISEMLGLADSDVDMIRNVGTVIDDDSVRSLLVSTRLLGTREIMIINHTDCGMLRFTDNELEERLRKETGRAPIAPARFYSFHRRRGKHQGADPEGEVTPMGLGGGSCQGICLRRRNGAAQRSVRRRRDLCSLGTVIRDQGVSRVQPLPVGATIGESDPMRVTAVSPVPRTEEEQ